MFIDRSDISYTTRHLYWNQSSYTPITHNKYIDTICLEDDFYFVRSFDSPSKKFPLVTDPALYDNTIVICIKDSVDSKLSFE